MPSADGQTSFSYCCRAFAQVEGGFRGAALNRKPQMLPLLLYNQLERLSISTRSTLPRHQVSSMTVEKDAGTPRVLLACRGLTLLVFIAMSHANTIYDKSG